MIARDTVMSNDQTFSFYATVYSSLYFAAALSTAFYSIACIQAFFYYVRYEHDPLWIKIFVTTLWALNTIHEALTVYSVYKLIMVGLQNPLSFVVGNSDELTGIVPHCLFLDNLSYFQAVAAIPAQGFLVYRLYVFSKNNIIVPIAWVVTALVVLACSIVYVSKTLYETDGNLRVVPIDVLESNPVVTLVTIWFSVPAAVDVLIAASMTFLLLRERSTIGFARTAHILQRLTVFAINTGTWTTTFAVLTLVTLHVYQLKPIYLVFSLPICPIYCNTVLANLNARDYLRGEDVVHTDLFLTPSMRDVADNNVVRFQVRGGQGECSTYETRSPQSPRRVTSMA